MNEANSKSNDSGMNEFGKHSDSMSSSSCNASSKEDTIRILLVEDSEFDLEAILRSLKKEGLKAEYKNVFKRDDFVEALKDSYDLIICDHKLPDFDSFEAFEILKKSGKDIPFIIISGAITEELAAQTLKRGASDFLSKNSLTRLGSSVREALVNKRLRESTRHAEAELKDTQERLRIAIASTALGTWDYKIKEGRFNACQRCRSVHNFPKTGDIDIESAIHSIDETDRIRITSKIKSALLVGHDHDLQIEYKTQQPNDGGILRWVSLRGRVYYNEINVPERFSGIMLDITDTKNLESRLRLAADAAQHASQAKSDFLANMSHEIRTPLAAILGFTELLKTADPATGELQDFIETISRNGEELARLIDEILDLSKIEAGRLEFLPVIFNLGDVVHSVATSLMTIAKQKGISISTSSLGMVPIFVFSDPGRLRQILFNIMGNAVKFTGEGSVSVQTQMVTREGQNPLISIAITDTGIGIQSKNLQHLFQLFQQADSSTTRLFGGTGLGLTLSRRLAEALGGNVVLATSNLGQGSTFVITIDAGIPESEMSVQADTASLTRLLKGRDLVARRSIDFSGIHVLLAEDVVDNQKLVKRLLEKKGASVEIVDDGEKAIESALGGNHDFVLMDMQMPHLDGLQATKRLRSLGYTKPIVAFTAHAMREEQEKCAAAGCNDYLTKPVNFDAFYQIVLKYRNKSRVQGIAI